MKNQPETIKTDLELWIIIKTHLEPWKTSLEPWKTNLEPWKPIKTDLEKWKTNLNPWKPIITDTEPYRTNLEPSKLTQSCTGWLWVVQVVTRDSQEEVLIFRDKQTGTHFIIIYISTTSWTSSPSLPSLSTRTRSQNNFAQERSEPGLHQAKKRQTTL